MGVAEDISKMKVAELKKALKDRGLAVTGNKQELVDRLQEAMQSGDGVSLEAASQGQAASAESPSKATAANKVTEKKISLKRSVPAPVVTAEDPSEARVNGATETVKTLPADSVEEASIEPPKKVAKLTGTKLSEDSAEEKPTSKMEERAKRFGEVTSEETVKKARAARFGPAEDDDTNKTSNEPVPVDVETMKKRADRFGEVTAKSLTQVESVEKMKQRQERFGSVTQEAAKKLDKVPDSTLDAAKAARAERFGPTDAAVTSEGAKKKRAERFAAK